MFLVKAPARVNLIGEHTDYQLGYVLPFAIDRYIWVIGDKRKDKKIKIYSVNYKQFFQTSLSEISYQKNFLWVNYILGIIKEFLKLDINLSGMEIKVEGNIPIGSGLSSSAALEISIAAFINKIFEVNLSPIEIIKLAKRAENEFIGVKCGIMDQFSSYLSKENHAILLNCKTLQYEYIPLYLKDYQILLVDTKKERKLSSSFYNERVKQVEKALQIIKKEINNVEFLCDITLTQLRNFKKKMDNICYKRALHIVEENKRVLDVSRFLKNGEVEKIGNLIYASHESLKNLYQVSCEELDFIVDFCKNFKEVLGARLTGAGFGGCCIVLIKKFFVKEFKKELASVYNKKFPALLEFYEVKSVNGSVNS